MFGRRFESAHLHEKRFTANNCEPFFVEIYLLRLIWQQSSARRAHRASSPQRLICSRRTAYFPAAVLRYQSPPSHTCTYMHYTCIPIYVPRYARSTNSDFFLYFVHAFPYITNKSIARSTNLNEFLYFAHKYVQQPDIIEAPRLANTPANRSKQAPQFSPRAALPALCPQSHYQSRFFFFYNEFLFLKRRFSLFKTQPEVPYVHLHKK